MDRVDVRFLTETNATFFGIEWSLSFVEDLEDVCKPACCEDSLMEAFVVSWFSPSSWYMVILESNCDESVDKSVFILSTWQRSLAATASTPSSWSSTQQNLLNLG